MTVLKLNEVSARIVRPFRFSDLHQVVEMPSATGLGPETESNGSSAIRSAPGVAAGEEEALRRKIDELESALSELATRSQADREAARQEGRDQGLKEAETKDAERLEVLRKSLKAAYHEMQAALEVQTSWAVEIARAALRQMLGDKSRYAELIKETAVLWKGKLAGTPVLKIGVSACDFPDEDALRQLQSEIGKIDIEIDPELAPGTCIFDLQLGRVDASIPVQSARIDTALAEHSLEPAQR